MRQGAFSLVAHEPAALGHFHAISPSWPATQSSKRRCACEATRPALNCQGANPPARRYEHEVALHNLLTLPNILVAFTLINCVTFILFGFDKRHAASGSWRISEGTLLVWAFFGGSIGAYAGRAVFRHKTRKQPFSSHLHQTAILHAIAAVLAAVCL